MHTSPKKKQMRILIGSLSAFLFLLILLPGCSHIKPYYRSDVRPPRTIRAEEGDLRYRLLLIGDAGETDKDDPVLLKLEQWASKNPDKTMVIFLGDNIYPDGLPEEGDSRRSEAERLLLAQIEVIKRSGANGFFIPGNHDWHQGLKGLIRQEKFIKKELGRDNTFFPPPGCPGPTKIDVENIRIIVIDSGHWLNKKVTPETYCTHKDLESSVETLKTLIRTAEDRHIVFVAHYPLDTHGIHGGFYSWQDHLFPLTRAVKWLWIPLPVIGSLYPVLRWNVIKHPEDHNSPEFKNMRSQLLEAFRIKKPLIYAGGHEHALQVLDGIDAAELMLVSGAGSKSMLSSVGHKVNTLFAHLHTGFMAVDFLSDGRIWLYVVEPSEDEVVFSYEVKTNR
jgi:hypothetical protein